jgi:uncharacterized membrane protein
MIAQGGFRNFAALPKSDILQQIGLSLVLVAPLCAPGKRTALRTFLGLAALLLLVAPVSALPPAPSWARPLTDFVTGGRPMSPFPALPWAAYAVGGALYGALVRGLEGKALARRAIALAVAGFALAVFGKGVLHPWVVAHFGSCDPNHCLDAAARVIYRLGGCVALTGVAHAATAADTVLWRPLLLMGRRSLLIYCAHVPFVYGALSRRWAGKHSSLWPTSLAIVALLLAMIALAATWERWRARRRSTSSG